MVGEEVVGEVIVMVGEKDETYFFFLAYLSRETRITLSLF